MGGLFTVLALVFGLQMGMAAVSTQPKNFQSGVGRLSDGTGTPVTLVVSMGKGDLQWGEIGQYLNEDVFATVRTVFLGLMNGEPRMPEVSGSFFCSNVVGSTNSAPGSFVEFATGKGAYSANVSTLGASRNMTIDYRQTIEGTAWGDTADETIDFEDCRVTFSFAEAKDGNTVSWKATVCGNVIVTNNTNVVTFSQAT